jgi:hypothetical protein
MIRKWLKHISRDIYIFKEIQIASKTFSVMLIPVMTCLVILELYIPKASILGGLGNATIKIIPDLKFYILYLTASASHIILSIIVIIILSRKLSSDNGSYFKRKIVFKWLLVFISVITLLFIVIDGFHANIALLSHERIYFYLLRSEYFSKYFRLFPNLNFFNGFYIFSFLSFSLIFMGLIIIVLTCFNIGKDLSIVLNEIVIDSDESKKKMFQGKIEEFHNYLYILSFILVTSTIATILFFHIPLTIIKEGEIYQIFQSSSLSMGICWGVIFSLTMLTMCLYPFFVLNTKLKDFIRSSEIAGNNEMKIWFENLQNNYLVFRNVKSMISVVAPTFVSLLAQFI